MNVTRQDRAFKTSAWFLYTLVVLEILFMVSPFAAYYYSIYATPLNALQTSPYTSWLTMYLLPHFSYSACPLANALLVISWPLILLGTVLFVIGFCQIYWSKFTGKGAVEVGLYRHVRHPQYVALAIVGLGAALYWSRFVVILAFVFMLCLYHYLARMEERICLDKFGESYRRYLEKTGMFLPRKVEASWRTADWRIPESRRSRAAVSAAICIATLFLVAAASFHLRTHVISSIQTQVSDSRVTVYLAPVSPESKIAVESLLDEASLAGDIAYVAPASWHVPELGLQPSIEATGTGHLSELLHPSTHGNPLSYQGARFNAVAVEVASHKAGLSGIDRLSNALNVKPIEFLELDVADREILSRRSATGWQWAGIPVPTF